MSLGTDEEPWRTRRHAPRDAATLDRRAGRHRQRNRHRGQRNLRLANNHSHNPDTLHALFGAAGATCMKAWYGVRVFTDHLADAPVDADFDQILAAEWAAGARDPYRGIARLFTLIARRTIGPGI